MIYYVSKEGNNLNTGQSLAQSFLTITKGLQSVAAGDTIRIMPGIYNELASCVTSGTALANIDIVCCNDGIDNKTGALISANYKGKVIVSFIDNYRNEVASNAQFTFNTRQYVNLYGLQLNTKINSIVMSGNNCNIYNCNVNYTGGLQTGIIGNVATYKTDNNNVYNTTIIGSYRGITYVTNVWNCYSTTSVDTYMQNLNVYYSIGVGNRGFVNNNLCVNCTGYKNNISFANNVTSADTFNNYNCLSVNSVTAYNTTSQSITNYYNCFAINVNVVINVASSIAVIDISSIYAYSYITATLGTALTGSLNILTYSWNSNYFDDINKYGVCIINETENTTQLNYSTIRDIDNKPLKLIDGVIKVGAKQSSIIEYIQQGTQSVDYYQTLPTLKIKRKGVKCIRLRCKGGVQKTASVFLKYDLDGGTLRPQLLLRDVNNNKIVDEQDITLTAGSGFIEITCTFTPKNDGVVEFQIFNRETGVNSYCIISDFKLT